MGFLLSKQNVINFLVEKGITGLASQQDSAVIESRICKNFNLLVKSREKKQVLVKQEPHDRNGQAKGDFAHEWQVYALIKHFKELSHLSFLCSPASYFDSESAVLVFNYLTDYCDLEEFYRQHCFYPVEIADYLGQTLAEFHRLTLDNSDYKSFLKSEKDFEDIPDLSKDLSAIYPEIFGAISSDGIKFYELYQRDPSLAKAIANLNDLYEPCCLIHNDLKFNNILLHLRWQDLKTKDLETTPIRLIDWEKWSWGDPGLDLGSLIASYLKLWLNSVTINRYISIEQALSLAAIPLETIQPSLITLFQSYCRHFPQVLAEFPDFLSRVMQFAGLSLIESILAKLDYYEPFDNISICLLQVAKSLLCTPEKAIPIVFGLTTEEILNLDYQDSQEKELKKVIETKTQQITAKKANNVVKTASTTLRSEIFNDRYDLVVRDIAEKIEIKIDYSIVYGDREPLTLPDKLQNYFVQLSPTQQETYLKYQLRDYLHEIYFSNEQTFTEDLVTELQNNLHRGINIDFYQQLSDRHCGKGYFDYGWNVLTNPDRGLVLAQKNALTLHIDIERHLAPNIKYPSQGDTIGIRLPHNRIESEFYVAIGDGGLIEEEAMTISVYFNIDSQGAIVLMKKLTEYLNSQIIPFEFSVLIVPEDYYRYDASILKIPHRYYQTIQPTLTEILLKTRSHFQPQIPLFTKQIALGVGLAEDPSVEPYDFGSNRCQIIADALIAAWKQNQRSPKQKINLIEKFLTQQKVDIKHPYLNFIGD
jgi:hypothetical protein